MDTRIRGRSLSRPRCVRATRALQGCAALLAAAATACSFDFDRTWIDTPQPRDVRWPDTATPRDAGGTKPTPDGAPAPPAALPQLCYEVAEQARTASCPAGWVAIAGATSCSDNRVERCGLTSDGNGWSVSCSGGDKPQFTEVICARGEGFRRLSAKGAAGGDAAARCAAWEVAMSGGCECTGGAVHTNDYAQGAESWICACDGGATPTAHVTCFHATTAARLGRSVSRGPGTEENFAEVSCSKGLALTGGCDADRSLTGMALGAADSTWVCVFDQTPAEASLTVICLSDVPGPCPR